MSATIRRRPGIVAFYGHALTSAEIKEAQQQEGDVSRLYAPTEGSRLLPYDLLQLDSSTIADFFGSWTRLKMKLQPGSP